MANGQTAKEKGASQYQAQKKVVEDLLTSANDGDLEYLKKTVESIQVQGVTDVAEILLDFKDAHERSAVHFAATNGRKKVLAYILDQAPDAVNARDEEGATPLLYAAKANEFATVKLLLAGNADPNLTRKNGTSALHEAAANGNVRTCKLLVEHKANLEAQTPNGTALHFAVSEDREKTVQALLDLGANVNALNANGVTPLLLATLMKKTDIAKRLLSSGADLSVAIMGGLTALHIAAETGFLEIVQEFFNLRQEDAVQAANRKSDAGATAVQLAAGMGHREIVELLKPVTKGFESVDTLELMQQEKLRADEFYTKAEASKAQEDAQKAQQEQDEAQAKAQQILQEIPSEDAIEIPTVQVDEATAQQANALKDQGNKAYIAKDFPKAIELYSLAIELNPNDAFLYSNRCAAHLGNGDAKKALYDVRVSKKLKPDWPKALFREGQCLEALQLYEEAACAMWSAIQLAPDDKVLKKRFQECVARGRADHQGKQAK